MACAGLGAATGTMGVDNASPRLDGSISAEGPTFVARSGMEYGSCILPITCQQPRDTEGSHMKTEAVNGMSARLRCLLFLNDLVVKID